MWQAALSTRRLWESGAWQRGFGVTLAEPERLNQAVAQALDSQLLTREELAARVSRSASPARHLAGRLLPAFDQYVVTATRQAEHLLPGPFKARVYRPQGWLSPVLLVGGRMEGVWRQEVKDRRVQVTIEPFAGSPPAWVRRAAEDEAERLAAVASGQLELCWAD
jgi:hypothetical protein